MRPSLMRLNTFIQNNIIRDEHIPVQEVDAFTSKFGLLYNDPAGNLKDMSKKLPSLYFLADRIRISLSGRQEYNAYLGIHGVGKGMKGLAAKFDIEDAKRKNHVAPSNSACQKNTVLFHLLKIESLLISL